MTAGSPGARKAEEEVSAAHMERTFRKPLFKEITGGKKKIQPSGHYLFGGLSDGF